MTDLTRPLLDFAASAEGLRAGHAMVTNDDGSVHRVVNIGVPHDHPLAAPEPNGPAGLHNMRLGAMPLPVAPTFVIRMRRPRERENENNDGPDVTAGPASAGSGPRVTIAPHREVTDEELQ